MMARFLATSFLATVVLVAWAANAQAGFTLIAPPDATSQPPATVVAPPEPITQNVISGTHVGPEVILTPAAPVSSMATPVTLSPPPTSNVAPVIQGDKIVHGFGKDIPLVVAAQQIAPSNLQVAFGDGVDPSVPISWHGGQEWHQVLSNALSARGLQAAEHGNILFISRAQPASAATPASLVLNPPKDQMMNPSAAPVVEPPSLTSMPASTDANLAPSASVIPAPVTAVDVVQNTTAPQPIVVPPAPTAVTTPTPKTEVTQLPTIVEPPAVPMPVSTIATALPAIAPAAPAMPTTWQADAGKTLRQTLDEWCKTENINLIWNSEFDYPIKANISANGSFEDGVRTLLRGFSSAQPQPVARLYRPNPSEPGVLIVTARGNDLSQRL